MVVAMGAVAAAENRCARSVLRYSLSWLDAKYALKVRLEEFLFRFLGMRCQVAVEGTQWISAALNVRVVTGKHVEVGIGMLD